MARSAADDGALWRWAMRGVAPLRRRADHLHPGPPPLAEEERERAKRREVPAHGSPAGKSCAGPPPPQAEPLDRFAGVDRATADRVRRGRYPVEAKLDLHGMTQVEAHSALKSFIPGSRAAGRRCVLVVTGHGRSSGGVLKAAVPRWLDEPELRRHVLAVAPARPQHGGHGALYVLLRRERG